MTESLRVEFRVDYGREILFTSRFVQFTGRIEQRSAGHWDATVPLGSIEPEHRLRLRWVDTVTVRRDDGSVAYTGVVTPGGEQWAEDADDGKVAKWRGFEGRSLLDARLAWPDPTSEPPWESPRLRHTGPAANAVTTVISRNLGPPAIDWRQWPGLIVRTEGGGEPGVWWSEGQVLGDMVAQMCDEGLVECRTTFDVNRPGIDVVAYPPADRTADVRISSGDLLVGLQRGESAATGTAVLAAADTEDGGKVWRLERNERSTWMVEQFVDAQEDETLAQAARAALRDGARKPWLTAQVLPATDVAWVSDVRIGDLVAVEIDGEVLALPVVAFDVTINDQTQQVTPTFGSTSRSSLRRLAQQLRRMERAIARQQRRS